MVNIGIGTAGLAAFLGYLVDFIGIVLLMLVIIIMGKIMHREPKKEKVTDLGSIEVPVGINPKKAAAIFAAIAEEERWGRVDITAQSSGMTDDSKLKKIAAIAAAIAEEEA